MKLRRIDQGTRYDLTGNLRRIAREIEQGKRGKVSDIVCCFSIKDGTKRSIDVLHWGTGGVETAHWLLSTAKNRVEPA